jgi:UDP-N-acetylmuramoyl-L-alanyl-D-glutamate--2,6-diaminopimelate ligase
MIFFNKMSLKSIIPQKLKNIYHLGQAILANLIYGFPSRRIKVIGVTGTNGKTTTVQMIGKILEEAGHKIALASTINFKLGEKKWVNNTKFTTLSPFAVQKFILRAVKTGCQYLVLETSSHSLDQNRVWGINYDTAVITNVTREHLDYHKTMEEYRKAKSVLFKRLKSNFQFSIFSASWRIQSIFNDKNFKKNSKVSIVNLDMDNPEYFLNFDADEKYGYTTQVQSSKFKIQSRLGGTKIKIVSADNIELDTNSTEFKIENLKFKIFLPGLFNVENALAATCVGLSQNISPETISKALEKIKSIPGRMEYVANDKGLNIIIDYAVTPDSLEKLYDLIKNIRDNSPEIREHLRIVSVFGACGERDRGKRPMMGEIVSRYADYIVVTNEDPYGENPLNIINEVFSGVVGYKVSGEIPNFQFPNPNFQTNPNDQNSKFKKVEGINTFRILDRREAIKKALRLAKPGDYMIVTGKGAEETMAVGNKRIPWNDKKVIQALLKE